jgi:hypothetical protein
MLLYLDDDSTAGLLIKLLRKAKHDVQTPADVNLAGRNDAVHLDHSVQSGRTCLTRNHEDFGELHDLIQHSGGTHPGILVVRKDNNPKRDMDAQDTVRAIAKLLASGVTIANELHVLNHWR